MARYTRDTGEMESHMARVATFVQMVVCKKVIGSTTKLMVTEHMCIMMDLDTKVDGLMISNMVMEKKSGPTTQNLWVNM